MNHAITIGDFILSFGALIGILLFAFGILDAFGNMMADTAGDNGKEGCTLTIIGAVLAVGCLVGLFV
jgi:hypothetical protein